MRRAAIAALVAASLLGAGCDGSGGSGGAATTTGSEDPLPPIVIESPLPRESVTSPIHVTGTANVFEATVSLEVRDDAGDVVLRDFTTATSGNGTRGSFETELAVPDLEGPATIVAFEASAKDSSPLHVVEVPITVSH
jgi:hypothetical protein